MDDWKDRLRSFVRAEWRAQTAIRASDRPWQMPFAASLAMGLPLLFGAWFNQMAPALIGSLGGLVFLYLPRTALQHRMVTLMACGFGMVGCFALGVLSHLLPAVIMPALALCATLVTMVCRVYRLGPPGSLFFVMAAAIGADAPGTLAQVPERVGLLALGAVGAGVIALVYSVLILRIRDPLPVAPLPPPTFDFVVFDSIIVGLSVGVSFLAAQLLDLHKAYWVAVSCLAVIQGVSRRSVWERQIHRVVSTSLGLVLTWLVFALPFDRWGFVPLVMVLAFVIETLVVRHYGFATVFITPMAILLGDATSFPLGDASALIQARFIDTVLGSLVGFLGGMAIHSQGVRQAVGAPLRRVLGGQGPEGVKRRRTVDR
ncbi:FUSC family protein [Nitrogeniibacter mangrovi]|nr:FUSC family protein [Nitrogeniibacter mangrovi]